MKRFFTSIRHTVHFFLKRRRTDREVQRHIRSYKTTPQTDAEIKEGRITLRALIEEEPW
jgi:hypothetical protein